MKNITRFLIGLLALTAVTISQAATDPVSAIQNTATGQCITLTQPMTMTKCDLSAKQNFNFPATGEITIEPNLAVSGANCLTGSFTVDGPVSMSSCNALSSNWWRSGKQIRLSGGTQCLTQMGSNLEMQSCLADNVNQQWTLASEVAADWPRTGLTSMTSTPTGFCLQVGAAIPTTPTKPRKIGGITIPSPPNPASLRSASCKQYMNEFFQFTPTGTIVVQGMCVTDGGDGAVGDQVVLMTCDGRINQQWTRNGDTILSKKNGLCIGITNNSSDPNATTQLQKCGSDPHQQLGFSRLASSWPPAASVPSTAVSGATLTNQQVTTLVDWIQDEVSISNMPFCYKTGSYDRGIGIKPDSCKSGKEMDAGLCYKPCSSGFKGAATICKTTDSLTYNPGSHCTAHAPKWLGGRCIASAMNSCRAGYRSDNIATCWINKASYDRGAGELPTSCNSNRQLQAGLCYLTPRSGFSCNVTNCQPVCAAGSKDCLGASCTKDVKNCTASITDMVVSTAEVLAFIVTEGESAAVDEAVNAVKNAKNANDLAQAIINLQSDVESFMQGAETNFAAFSTTQVEASVAAVYERGSDNYNYIAREWAARLLLINIAQLELDLDTILITTLDPTGVTSTINAFAKPPCRQHRTMPQV
ncbi:ricin-type beta-trefoil lectin domain protein [Methylomonas sp. AM2-LC]|uniref:RICIN domain-containing protein n=1 Tax=Methylomonas sp. AM2-LC TaxID=3153301 RepID=UPI0032639AF4